MVVLMRIAWEPVQINTGYGSTGFNLEESSLTWSEQKGFGGWLGKSPINIPFQIHSSMLTKVVCDWYHSAPQLFYLYAPYEDPKIPSSCSKAELKVEYV